MCFLPYVLQNSICFYKFIKNVSKIKTVGDNDFIQQNVLYTNTLPGTGDAVITK